MWNWLKNLFGGKKQDDGTVKSVAGQPMPKAPENTKEGGEEDASKGQS